MRSSNKPACSAPAHPGHRRDNGDGLHCHVLPLCQTQSRAQWGHTINPYNSVLWDTLTTSISQMTKVRHREVKKLA